jgi:glycine oxidase
MPPWPLACFFFASPSDHIHMATIDVLGAGIAGVWQAFMLQRRGHYVSLWDPAGIPSPQAASRLAGAMLAPHCEGEPGHEVARDLGIESLLLWKDLYPAISKMGTLVVAAARDRADLQRFASVTEGYRRIKSEEIGTLEPALEGRFRDALYYDGEAHVEPAAALSYFIGEAVALGVTLHVERQSRSNADWVVDCRGLAARDELKTLRGVRGERVILEYDGASLHRPIRLLHPRIPFYIVPWPRGRFMIGATVIESDDDDGPTLRSAAELMSAAYALLPALGEARITDVAAGVRPSFADNAPKIIVRGRRIFVNGMYRHGFLLSPILAQLTGDYIELGTERDGVIFEDHGEW